MAQVGRKIGEYDSFGATLASLFEASKNQLWDIAARTDGGRIF
jgi:hypothetical protein